MPCLNYLRTIQSHIVPDQVETLFELVSLQFVLMLMPTLLGHDHDLNP